jgi:hypothetical protein
MTEHTTNMLQNLDPGIDRNTRVAVIVFKEEYNDQVSTWKKGEK